jgi:hypothetical protein
MPEYRHTQTGWPVYGVLIPLSLFLMYALLTREPAVLGLLGLIFGAVVLLFGWLTVDINTRRVLISFGVGLVRRTISLDTIRGFAPVRNRWWYGWGIRFTPHGILYNVSGLQAVELLLHDGRRVRVGTDEPEALARALQSATGVAAARSIDAFPQDTTWRRRMRLMTAVVLALVVAMVVGQMYLHNRAPSVVLGDARLTVSSGFYGADIPFEELQSIRLIDALPNIQARTNGYAAGGVLRGYFRVDTWGTGKLFINRNRPPYVEVRARDNTFVVVNFEDAARTRELYAQLRAKTERPR